MEFSQSLVLRKKNRGNNLISKVIFLPMYGLKFKYNES